MSCISPINIKAKNGARYNVPCSECLPCLSRKRDDWTFRLEQELKTAKSAVFTTLTYSDEELIFKPEGLGEATLNKEHLQKFIKAIRDKQIKNKWKIRYYAVGEYGTKTERPHYHIILFNAHADTLNTLTSIWGKGSTHIGACNPASIRYITKYVINRNIKEDHKEKPFALMSTRPSIGHSYLSNDKFHVLNEILHVTNDSGKKQVLPRYYQDRMFDPVHKEAIIKSLEAERDEKDLKSYKKHGINHHEKIRVKSIERRKQKQKQKLNKKDKL